MAPAEELAGMGTTVTVDTGALVAVAVAVEVAV